MKKMRNNTKNAVPGEEVMVTTLPVKYHGKPPLLGEKLDRYLQEMIVAM